MFIGIGVGILGGGASAPAIPYLFRDEFTDDRSAGTITGTLSTDGKSARTSPSGVISSSFYNLNGQFSPTLWHDLAITRAYGQVLAARCKPVYGEVGFIGYSAAKSGNFVQGFKFSGGYLLHSRPGVVDSVLGMLPTPVTSNLYYDLFLVLRTTGAFFFVRGNEFVNTTLMYYDDTRTTGAYFATGGQTDYVCAPEDLFEVHPLLSDSFDGSNGAMNGRVADGLGHVEADGHGAGAVWADVLGASAIATNLAVFSSLTGAEGLATIDAGNTDVMVSAKLTRAAGEVGIVARYTDVNNYIRVSHDGTNIKWTKVVAGVATTEQTAITYSASKTLIVSTHGDKLIIFYNEDCVRIADDNAGARGRRTIVDAALLTGTKVGIYSTDISNTFNSFQVWGKESNGL